MHQPRNRQSETLPILEIRIDHAEGSLKTCPNGVAGSAIWGMTGEKPDLPEKFLLPGSTLFEPTKLKPMEGLKSVISGGPAVMYRSDDIAIPMTPDELFRFAKHDLHPAEYFVLLREYGMFHEIHEDYYDPDSGMAFQPMGRDVDEEDGPDPIVVVDGPDGLMRGRMK